MKKHNLFITFEGGEGTGKSTTSKELEKKLKENGYKVVCTREPGGQDLQVAEEIRRVIMNHGEIHPITELLLFNASRREHVDKVIKPKLDEGNIVISDRFADSTTVYQGLVKGVDRETIIKANEIGMQETIPDLTFIFDLDPCMARKRILDNNRETNRFDVEGEEFYEKIRQGYLNLQKEDENRYIIIDASKPTSEIVEMIYNKIINHEN